MCIVDNINRNTNDFNSRVVLDISGQDNILGINKTIWVKIENIVLNQK